MDGPEIPLDILRLAEALVFASPEPVTWQSLQPLLPYHLDPTRVLQALERHCADRGVILVNSGGAWAFRTALDLAPTLRPALSETRRLPRAAMQTLVIIALYQPLTRSEIEDIRGVGLSQLTMDVLWESGLIEPKGHRETQGRPRVWVTTPLFLAQFGLRSLRDLPGSPLCSGHPMRAGGVAHATDTEAAPLPVAGGGGGCSEAV